MDIIYITQLKVDTTIGVYDWEKTIKQPLYFDIEIFTDIKQAAATENLDYTIDYDQISTQIQTLATQQHYNLIETLAEEVAAMILTNNKVLQVKVKLSKPTAIVNAHTVAVSILRGINSG